MLTGTAPHLIETTRLTVPALLKQHAYDTAAIGKWHLGMDWVPKGPGLKRFADVGAFNQVWHVDYTKPIANRPKTVGFDYYFGIAGSLDLRSVIENAHVTALPMVTKRWSGLPPVRWTGNGLRDQFSDWLLS